MKNDLENEVNKKKIKSCKTTTGHGFEVTTYAVKPEKIAHWAIEAVGDGGLKVKYKLAHVRYTPS